jgi:hypothetical protein
MIGKVLFEAEDNTGSAVANVNAGLAEVGRAAKKSAKEVEAAAERQQTAFSGAAERIRAATSGMGAMAEGGKTLRGALGDALSPFTVGLGAATAAVGAFVGALRFAEEWGQETRAAESATARLQVSIDGARQAMGGLVDDMTLARVANKGFALGVVSSGDDLERLAAGVRAISEDLGEDPTQLLEDAITGIGRKSTAILDNLGITLNQTMAEEEYAASLGKTVGQLTAYEKSQAFAKVAIEKVGQAARESTKANDSFGDSAAKARAKWDNFSSSVYGFDAIGGRIRETLRDMDEETLKLFGSRNATDIARINRMLAESGLNYEQIKDYVVDINNIETLRGGQLSREQRLQFEKGLLELTGEALRHQEKQIANAERLAAEAEREAKAKADADAVEALDHEVAILQAIGASEDEIVAAQEMALQLRIDQAEAAGDLAAQVENERKLELLLLGSLNKKNKARGRSVSLAEKITAAGERELQVMDETIARMRVLGQLRGTEADTALGVAELERKRRLAALDLEQRALEAARAKTSVERQRNENRQAQIAAERELIVLEQQNEQRVEANRLVAEAVAMSTHRSQAEAAAFQRSTDLQTMALDYEAEVIELDSRRAIDAERNAVRRVDIERDAQAKIIDLQRKRLEMEYKAEQASLDAREAALSSQSGGTDLEKAQRAEEWEQLRHDREVSRLNYEMQVRRGMEAEKAEMAAAEKARFDAQMAQVLDGLSKFEAFRGQTMELVSFFSQRNAEAQDADFQRQVNTWQQQGQAQKQMLEAQIKAAEGNVALQNQLRQRAAQQEAALQKKIEKAQARHQDRKRRQQMRDEGRALLIAAAVEGVKAVIAFASQNYYEGALHVAAAAVAGIKGGMLLSGKIPGGGAEANLSNAGGGMAANDKSNEYVDPSSVPGSTPGEAARRESATFRDTPQTGGGGTVINVSFGNVLGTMDQAAVSNLGRQLEDIKLVRER